MSICVRAKSLQSCLTLCDPVDCSPPGCSIHGILQARILERVAVTSSRGSSPTQGSDPSLLYILHWQAGSLPPAPPRKPTNVNRFSSVAQSCPSLCDPMDCSTPGFPVHHQLPKFTQTHVNPVGDAIQPSHPLSSPSPPAFSVNENPWIRGIGPTLPLWGVAVDV